MGLPEEERTHRRIQTRHDARRARRRDLRRQRGRRLELQEVGYHVPPLPKPERLYGPRAASCECWRTPGSKGIWESESIDGGWRCISPDFPPGGDCTFFFRWGKFDYIIGGFTGLWSKPADAPNSAYEDVVRKGLDFYDGSNVPAITEIAGGRFLMAAWIPIRGWGGNLVIRELIQFPDGRIGSKWMKEVTPAAGVPKPLAAKLGEVRPESRSFLLELEVEPGAGRLGIGFLPADGEQAGCQWQRSAR